jgi:sterol desaturase/sphingolipid hydroxylase (fatty acid hydroxylase superfamily)
MLGDMKAELKELLELILGPAYDLIMPLVGILLPFLYPGFLWWVFFLSAVLLAFYAYLTASQQRGDITLAGFIAYLAPKSVYRHQSAWLDCKYYVVNSILYRLFNISALAFAFAGLLQVAAGVRHVLTLAFGPATTTAEPSLLARLGYTLAIVAAVDFAKWLTHYLQHKIPALWEFHKVHHSAPVLTPLTNLRVHPVDVLLENTLAGIASALVVGLYGYLYSTGVVEITLYGMAVVYFIAGLFAPLRHSHIPFAFGPRLSKLFCSPVMHQFHHSAETKHFDKNFSLIFSIWDYLAGTIYIPARGETPAVLGIGKEGDELRSVWALYTNPFISLARRLRKRPLPARA